MTETVKMILKMAALLVPALVLYATLYTGSKGNGIGGGSYDLSELVYGGLFMVFVVCWNIWMLISLLMAKASLDKQHHKILLIIGIIVLIAVAIWFIKLF